jgi:DNA phosphorothioation-associated putative methyltransferase
VRTQRGTFQKYYTQAEIKAFLEEVLDEEAIPVAPGVHYVFRDKDAEQRFFVERYRSQRNRLRDPSVRERPGEEKARRDRAAEKYAAHESELEALWDLWLGLGRRPDESEVDDALPLTEGFGSVGKALRFLEAHKAKERGEDEVAADLAQAEVVRVEDLTVYFALEQFERRMPYKHLEPRLKRDVRQFFGDYRAAESAGWEQLRQIADVAAVEKACREAAEHGVGWLITDDGLDTDGDSRSGDGEGGSRAVSLQLDARLVEQLPGLLRVYVGAASAAYGDYRNADLIKIHIGSGKLTLMRFDDFDDAPLPRMLERVKIKLREQDVEYFAYGVEYEPPFLYHKSRYINEEFPHYPEQVAFEETLEGLGLFDFSGYGPSPGEFLDTLAKNRWAVEGFELVRAGAIPDLDDPCGRYLTFRQLIHCGETQEATGLPNLPKQVESYNALLDLATHVLDPMIEYFGMIRLTYGFCSPELARKIPGRIDPKRDQHAAHELNRRGRAVCERLGAAVDFIVDDESMLEVAQWVVANTPFDRLYFYGDDKPIHVSVGPNHDRQIVRMVQTKSGSLLPRVVCRDDFLAQA